MFCPNCGANISDNAAFCRNCGKGIQSEAQHAPQVEPSGANATPVGPGGPPATASTSPGNLPAGMPAHGMPATPAGSGAAAPSGDWSATAPAYDALNAAPAYGMSAAPAGTGAGAGMATAPGGQPTPALVYGASAPAPSYGAPAAASKSGAKVVIIVALAAIVVAAAVVVAGFLTGWFGLAPKGDPVYVIKSSVSYGTGTTRTNGVVTDTFDTETRIRYDRDGHGNMTLHTQETYRDGELWSTFELRDNRDENGYVKTRESESWYAETDTHSTSASTIDSEFDGQGRIVKWVQTNDEGGKNIETMTYYDNGQRKRDAFEAETSKQASEFDENGYIKKYSYERDDVGMVGTKSSSYDVKWKFDSAGHPMSYTVAYEIVEVGEKGKETTDSGTRAYDVETDAVGNIAKIYLDGKLVAEYEYERVDNPSIATRSSIAKPYTFDGARLS